MDFVVTIFLLAGIYGLYQGAQNLYMLIRITGELPSFKALGEMLKPWLAGAVLIALASFILYIKFT